MKLYSYTIGDVVRIILGEVHDVSLSLREKHVFLKKHRFIRRSIMSVVFLGVTVSHYKKYLELLSGKMLYVDHIEVVITTHCSLRCKHCANLIQYYEHPYHISKEMILESIQKFTEIVDYARKIRILGGEPLLHPELAEILNYICQRKNVDIVEIVTNGTVVPKSEVLKKYLQNKKVILMISDYGNCSYHKTDLLKYCEDNKIRSELLLSDSYWSDFGGIQCRNRTIEELEEQLKRCEMRCYSLLNGKLHRCPHSSNGEDLGLFTCTSDEYVDLFSKMTLKEKKRELYEYITYGPKKLTACNYCDNGNGELPKVKLGEQWE